MVSSLLKHPPFLRFEIAQLCTVLSYQMLVVAVGWEMYDLTNSPLSLGFVGLAQFSPQLLLTLVVGQAADRYNRKRIALLCQITLGLVALVLAVAITTHRLSEALLYICSIVIGGSRAFENPTMQAMIPLLVERQFLPSGMALNSAAKKSGTIVGPALGGLMFYFGANVVFFTCTAFYLVGVTLMSSLHLPKATAKRQPPTLKFILGGFSYIRARSILKAVITLDMFAVMLGGVTALLPIYARDILFVGPVGLGVLRAAPAAGAVLMSMALAISPPSRRIGRVLFTAIAAFGVATVVFALSKWFPLSLAALVLLGASDMVSEMIRSILIQLETPDEMRGRVTAVESIFTSTAGQLGQFESGVTAAMLGTVPAAVIGGIGTLLVVCLWMKMFPVLLNRNALERGEELKTV